MAKKIKNIESKEAQIRLHGIELISSSFSHKPKVNEPIKNYNFSVNVEIKIDPLKKLIISFVKTDIRPIDETNNIIASFYAAVGIEILNFEEVVDMNNIKNNVVELPSGLDTMLRTIAISTMRGIIFSELRGTHLHAAHLPIIVTQLPTLNKED